MQSVQESLNPLGPPLLTRWYMYCITAGRICFSPEIIAASSCTGVLAHSWVAYSKLCPDSSHHLYHATCPSSSGESYSSWPRIENCSNVSTICNSIHSLCIALNSQSPQDGDNSMVSCPPFILCMLTDIMFFSYDNILKLFYQMRLGDISSYRKLRWQKLEKNK
jgi:hypothetical protein